MKQANNNQKQTQGNCLGSVWYVETSNTKEGGWSPLPQSESDYLEHLYISGQGNETNILIRGTHSTVNMRDRTIVETYIEGAKPKKLIRGTWFWKHGSGKFLPFEEAISMMIEEWISQADV
jgi:hypothetical protein